MSASYGGGGVDYSSASTRSSFSPSAWRWLRCCSASCRGRTRYRAGRRIRNSRRVGHRIPGQPLPFTGRTNLRPNTSGYRSGAVRIRGSPVVHARILFNRPASAAVMRPLRVTPSLSSLPSLCSSRLGNVVGRYRIINIVNRLEDHNDVLARQCETEHAGTLARFARPVEIWGVETASTSSVVRPCSAICCTLPSGSLSSSQMIHKKVICDSLAPRPIIATQ